MTPVRRSFNVGGRKIITRILTAALCLNAAQHTSLYAPIYDLTKNPDQANQTWDEYKIKGNKSFSVKNNLDRKVYVRIGYAGPIGPVCEYTGFILNPGQTGKVLKSPICRPYIVSEGEGKVEQWEGYEDRLGDFAWTVTKPQVSNISNKESIKYLGKWGKTSTFKSGSHCWEAEQFYVEGSNFLRCGKPYWDSPVYLW